MKYVSWKRSQKSWPFHLDSVTPVTSVTTSSFSRDPESGKPGSFVYTFPLFPASLYRSPSSTCCAKLWSLRNMYTHHDHKRWKRISIVVYTHINDTHTHAHTHTHTHKFPRCSYAIPKLSVIATFFFPQCSLQLRISWSLKPPQ